MSKSGIEKKNLDFKDQGKKSEYNDHELITQINLLKRENENLKDLIIDHVKKESRKSPHQPSLTNIPVKNQPNKKGLYFQIILAISVIILSLGFHILYLSVTDCLLFSGGDSGCWIKNWLGMDIHASFYLDLFLYSLIAIEVLLILLIIRNYLVSL
jgi:hypothetical protein